MRLWDIFEISVPVLSRWSKQSKLKKDSKIKWAGEVGHSLDAGVFPLYTQVITWHIQQQRSINRTYLCPTQKHIREQIWSGKMIKEFSQELLFLKTLAHAKPLWFHMTKEQHNTRIRLINKFHKDINVNIVLCQNLNDNCYSFGLKIFLGTLTIKN